MFVNIYTIASTWRSEDSCGDWFRSSDLVASAFTH
jgi:heme-degrading monooxygenase HmoA